MNVTKIDHHRNGISGENFYVCHFEDPEYGNMMAVVFPPEERDEDGEPKWIDGKFHNPRIAVFQESKLPDTTFMVNSFRGDIYYRDLYEAIAKWDVNPVTQRERGR